MNLTHLTGTIGVSLLLLAFFLHLFFSLSRESLLYLALNILGAGMACFASILLRYWPFIILEGIWTIVSIAAILRKNTYKK